MNMWVISSLMFGSMLLALAFGLPITFALGGVAAIFSYLFWGIESLYVIAANKLIAHLKYYTRFMTRIYDGINIVRYETLEQIR